MKTAITSLLLIASNTAFLDGNNLKLFNNSEILKSIETEVLVVSKTAKGITPPVDRTSRSGGQNT